MRLFQKGHTTIDRVVYKDLHICYLINHATKSFLILRNNYTTKVCLVLHELFVSKMRPKGNSLVDFCTTSLPTMHAYTHAH